MTRFVSIGGRLDASSNQQMSLRPDLIALLLVTSLGLSGQTHAITGTVTDPTGKPLAGVRVLSLPWEDTVTNTAGRYSVDKPASLIRFSKTGYRPRTRSSRSPTLDVVLDRGSDEWSPPICQPARDQRFGGSLKFGVPFGTRLHRRRDADYETVTILYRGSELKFGTGPHWSNGLPVPEVLAAMVLVRERNVRSPWDSVVAEYRGLRATGTHWRFVGTFTQTIDYDQADAIAARYFDTIVDTMCFDTGRDAVAHHES